MDVVRSLLRGRGEPVDGAAPMKMIVGLGNPGPEYAHTRHNLGFQVVETLAERHGLHFDKAQKRARIALGRINLPGGGAERVLLVKPLTYMNDSGEAVGQLRAFYKVPPANILVVFDDLDLPAGRMRLRPGGGSSGQKGVKSIIQHLSTESFPRLRVGIGRPPGKMNPVDFVLKNFSAAEEAEMAFVRAAAADAIETWLALGINEAMNRYNGAGAT